MSDEPTDQTVVGRYVGYLAYGAGAAALLFGVAATLGWLDLTGRLAARFLFITLVRADAVALAFRAPWAIVLALLIYFMWRGWYVTYRSWATTAFHIAG